MITTQDIKYSSEFWKIAEHISKARSQLSEKVYAKGTDKYRGDQEKEISITGVIGELIAQEYANDHNLKTKFAPLVDLYPIATPDVIFLQDGKWNLKMDIKTIPLGKNFLNINANSHNNPDKKVDYYWCIKLLSKEMASMLLIPHHDVYYWEQKIGYTEYFSKRI